MCRALLMESEKLTVLLSGRLLRRIMFPAGINRKAERLDERQRYP